MNQLPDREGKVRNENRACVFLVSGGSLPAGDNFYSYLYIPAVGVYHLNARYPAQGID